MCFILSSSCFGFVCFLSWGQTLGISLSANTGLRSLSLAWTCIQERGLVMLVNGLGVIHTTMCAWRLFVLMQKQTKKTWINNTLKKLPQHFKFQSFLPQNLRPQKIKIKIKTCTGCRVYSSLKRKPKLYKVSKLTSLVPM